VAVSAGAEAPLYLVEGFLIEKQLLINLVLAIIMI
jgi:hypothetical protein